METNKNSMNNLPHMGTFIKNKIDEKNISYAEIARRMNVTQPTINGYFYQNTLQTKTIWKLSHAINNNLFTDLTKLLPAELQNSNKTAFHDIIDSQLQEISDLKKEIAIYKDILTKKL
jgi:transcriptional regulator with XRE-family HTH domain